MTNVTKACYNFFATRNTTKNIIKFFSNRQRTCFALKLIIIIILRLLLLNFFFFCYLTFEGVAAKLCCPVLCFLLWCFHCPNKSKVLTNVSNCNIIIIIFSIYLYGVELLKLFLEEKVITCFLYYLFNDAVYCRCFHCVRCVGS